MVEPVWVAFDALVPLVRKALPHALVLSPVDLDGDARHCRIAVTIGSVGFSAEAMDRLPTLGLIAAYGAGFEDIDLEAARTRGIAVVNAGAANAGAVAEWAIALAMAAMLRLPAAHQRVTAGLWREPAAKPRRSVAGSRVGIVGLGAIGREIASKMVALGAELAWWGPSPKPGEALPRHATLQSLAEWCDVLILACPGGDETFHLVDRAIIDAVGPGGSIVSVARGTVMNEQALIDALRSGRLGGAGLDVFEPEPTTAERWRDVPNVQLSPHVGGNAQDAIDGMAAVLAQNVQSFLAGDPLLNRVA